MPGSNHTENIVKKRIINALVDVTLSALLDQLWALSKLSTQVKYPFPWISGTSGLSEQQLV